MVSRSAYISNEIIITAMDRFVWFVLMVVMSHLVTEFTRVTGYARGQRNELVLLNDTLLQPMPVQNMLLYPGQESAHYESGMPATINSAQGYANSLQQNAALFLSSLMGAGNNAAPATASNVEAAYPHFSFRPLIDSIFEIPISTLRAVNNLVGRLTGSYRQAPSIAQKSATAMAGDTQTLRLPSVGTAEDFELSSKPAKTPSTQMRMQMHEELA